MPVRRPPLFATRSVDWRGRHRIHGLQRPGQFGVVNRNQWLGYLRMKGRRQAWSAAKCGCRTIAHREINLWLFWNWVTIVIIFMFRSTRSDPDQNHD